VHLVTRNDSGEGASTEIALDELAGEGAAIVIAGLEAASAERAARWAQRHHVSVVVLAPTEPIGESSFVFSLGAPRAEVVRALVRALPGLATGSLAPIIDASEVVGYPADVGATGLTLAPPVPCDMPAARAGDRRFPTSQWDRDGTRRWLISGAAGCAPDLVAELGAAHARGTLALTLEAARLLAAPQGLRVLTAQAGVVPTSGAGDPRAEELRRFSAALGALTWWAALGRDAATLARAAVLKLPADQVTLWRAVEDRRAQARDQLAAARARLWSSDAAGWGDSRAIRRKVCVLDVGTASR
jgi:hypothetical protein